LILDQAIQFATSGQLELCANCGRPFKLQQKPASSPFPIFAKAASTSAIGVKGTLIDTLDQVPVAQGERDHRPDIQKPGITIRCTIVEGELRRNADQRTDRVLHGAGQIFLRRSRAREQGCREKTGQESTQHE